MLPFWLRHPALRRLRRIAKIVDGVAAFFAGVLLTTLTHEVVQEGSTVFDGFWGRGMGGLFVLATLIFFLSKSVQLFWLDPATRNADVILAAMQYLYFSSFGTESGHRITFLAPRWRNSPYTRPLYRWAYGSGDRLKSRARFRRGEGLAGLAWAYPGGKKTFAKQVPEFAGDDEAFKTFSDGELHIEEPQVKRLSKRTRRLRWMLCYGIVSLATGRCIGVLSLDSEDPEIVDRINADDVVKLGAIIASLIGSPSEAA